MPGGSLNAFYQQAASPAKGKNCSHPVQHFATGNGHHPAMHSFYTIPLIAYGLGFACLAFLPRWHWLALGTLAASSFCLWLFRDLSQADGPGEVIAVFVAAALALGFASGFIARTIILGARWSGRIIPRAVTLLATLILIPPLAYGFSSWRTSVQKARWTPPKAECTSSLHAATLGTMRLALPLAPIIAVGEGEEYAPTYQFDINEQARRFCRESAPLPPALTNVNLRLEPDPSNALHLRSSWFCTQRQDYSWWSEVCRRQRGAPPSEYPVKMSLCWIDHYNAARMHAFSADQLKKPPARDGNFVDIGDGISRFNDAHNSYFTRADLPGYLARCYGTRSESRPELYCSAGYRLTPEIGLIYDFRADADDFAGRSRTADARAREVVESLRAR